MHYVDFLKTFEAIEDMNFIMKELYDYASMMQKISPKFDKYPRHFLTTHKIACRNYNRLMQQFEEEDFQKQINKGMENSFGDYCFIYPESTQDIKDEAVQQNNCVSSYIERVIDGRCHILFLRKKDEPDKSLVTIEVKNGKIVQALQRFNHPLTKEQQEVVDKWNKWYAKKNESEELKMLVKGDKIRLVKPMGAFTNVGEVCDVLDVDQNGVISFKFGGYHKGIMSHEKFERYFEKVEPVEKRNVQNYEVGDTVKMVNANEALTPLEADSEYAIQSIQYGVVALAAIEGGTVYYISQKLFEDNFEVIPDDDDGETDESNAISVSAEQVERVMNHSKVVVYKAFDKCTVVMCQLPNGFVIVESSACVDPKNYDEEIGIEICMNKIKDRVWEMEGYKLQENIYLMNKADNIVQFPN